EVDTDGLGHGRASRFGGWQNFGVAAGIRDGCRVLRPQARDPELDLSVTLSTFMRGLLFPDRESLRRGPTGHAAPRPWQDARHGTKRRVRRDPGNGAP